MTKPQRIMVVDDERNIRKVLTIHLRNEGFAVESAGSYEEAVAKLSDTEVDLVLTDMRLPGKSGLAILQWVKRKRPFVPVVVITAFGSIDNAVAAMKGGAANYLTKPVDLDEMVAILRHALLTARSTPSAEGEDEVPAEERFGILGRSAALREVVETIHAVAASRANILITGESGTGKELVARAIHQASLRAAGPFIAINCAAIPAELIENELFGHESGAYTGAASRQVGKVEMANGGSLFLDEIGEMAVPMQIKLLRFLQERLFYRIGGREQISADCRILAATNRNLEEEVERGTFREDLYYRLNVIQIRMPPLRERKEDIGLLADSFLERYAEENQKFIRGVDPEAYDALLAYDWPGNIRELENIIERAVVLSRADTITLEDLPAKVRSSYLGEAAEAEVAGEGVPVVDLSEMTLPEVERVAVVEALKAEGWNQTRAAERLGITRRQLRTKMEKFHLL